MRSWSKWLLPVATSLVAVATLHVTPAEARTLCVGKEVVLLRSGPSATHNPVGSLPSGACGIQVVGKCASGWCEVALGSRRGWVNSRLVAVREGDGAAPATPPAAPKQVERSPKEDPPPRESSAREPARQTGSAPPRAPGYAPPAPQGNDHCVMGVAQGDTLRIRSGPGTHHREVSGIRPGACGVYLRGGCAGYWCPIDYRGVRGWVNATYLRPGWMR